MKLRIKPTYEVYGGIGTKGFSLQRKFLFWWVQVEYADNVTDLLELARHLRTAIKIIDQPYEPATDRICADQQTG